MFIPPPLSIQSHPQSFLYIVWCHVHCRSHMVDPPCMLSFPSCQPNHPQLAKSIQELRHMVGSNRILPHPLTKATWAWVAPAVRGLHANLSRPCWTWHRYWSRSKVMSHKTIIQSWLAVFLLSPLWQFYRIYYGVYLLWSVRFFSFAPYFHTASMGSSHTRMLRSNMKVLNHNRNCQCVWINTRFSMQLSVCMLFNHCSQKVLICALGSKCFRSYLPSADIFESK